MTTLLEQMTRAFWNSFSSVDTWEQLAPYHKEMALKHIRAALTVLAESDLPEIAIVAGGKAADDATEYDAPKFLEIVFKTTVRAIIEEKS